MNGQIKYRFIAAFFLVVFSASMVTGFACSVGIDMRYNSKHHESNIKSHCAAAKASIKHSTSGLAFKSEEKDCCVNNVNDQVRFDKSCVGVIDCIKVSFDKEVIHEFSKLSSVSVITETSSFNIQSLRRSPHLHHTDIRVHIQSFQI